MHLTSYPGLEREPAFSPDGNQVAFVWDGEKQNNRDVYVKLIGSGRPLRLTTDPADDFSPAWSPDGRWIAFLRSLPGEKAAVLLVSPLGGPERKLADVAAPEWWMWGPSLAWSPDSASLALSDRNSATESFSLSLLSVEIGEKYRLTSPPAAAFSDTSPAFSADGRNLAFCRAAGPSDLFVLALTPAIRPDGEPKQLTFGAWFAGSPSWVERRSWYLPGGRREIVFSSTRIREGLWRIAASGSRVPAPLPFGGEGASHPAISARAQRLAYTRLNKVSNFWRINSASGATAPLLGSTREDVEPQFSPDGKRIAFGSNRSGSSEVWVANSDGSDAVQLTAFGAITGAPHWSPDGTRLVFNSNVEGQFEVYAIGANGGKAQRLTTNPANDLGVSYSSDGQWIYFSSNRSGEFQVWKMRASGGKPLQVTRQGGYLALESRDAKWLYYLRSVGRESSLWKVPPQGGEETQVLESVIHYAFAMAAEGIYFLTDTGAQRSGSQRSVASLQFLSLATAKTKPVASVESPTFGLSVSPAGRQVLCSRVVQEDSDLMLVENFR